MAVVPRRLESSEFLARRSSIEHASAYQSCSIASQGHEQLMDDFVFQRIDSVDWVIRPGW